MKVLTTVLLSLLLGLTLQAQNPDLLDPFQLPLPNEEIDALNAPGAYEQQLYKQKSTSSMWRITATMSELYNAGNWEKTDSNRYTYHKDFKYSQLSNWNWDNIGINWESHAQIIWTHDSQNRNTQLLNQLWNGTQWQNNSKFEYVFNGSNSAPAEAFAYTWSGIWDYSQHGIYTYNPNNQVLTSIIQNWTAGVWINSTFDEKTYNSKGMTTSYIRKNWNGSNWVNNTRNLYSYNSDNKVVEYYFQTWNGSAWDHNYRTFYFYDLQQNLTEQRIEDYIGGIWEKRNRITHQYNLSHQKTLTEKSSWDIPNSSWYATERKAFIYDTQGNLTSETNYLMGMGWYFDNRYIYSYDANNNKILTTAQDYLLGWIDRDRTHYENESFLHSAINNYTIPNKSLLYPNPVKNIANLQINISLNSPLDLRIYNSLGQIVWQQIQEQITGEQNLSLNLAQLPVGNYFLLIQSNNEQQSIPFQKQ